jgi:hypothetical protein
MNSIRRFVAETGGHTGFSARLARTLDCLSLSSLRMSVIAVTVPGLSGETLQTWLRIELGGAYEIAPLDRATVGILYYGPRAVCGGHDRSVTDGLLGRMVSVLRERDSTRTKLQLRSLHIVTAHVCDPREIIDALRRTSLETVSLTDRQQAA